MIRTLAQNAIRLPGIPNSEGKMPTNTDITYPDTYSAFTQKFMENGSVSVGKILSNAIPLVFIIAGTGMLLMIIFAGFQLMTSAGDSKAMEKGQQTLTYAIVGFLIVILAYWITQTLGFVTGMDVIKDIFK